MENSDQTENIKILIMDTPIGSGHVVAAKALRTELEKQFIGAEILHLSTFEFLPKFLSTTFVKLYLLSLRISPTIYAFFYKWGNKEQSTASRDRLNKILANLARKVIVEFQPDIAVATHATPAGIFSQLKSAGLLPRCAIYGVVTDYVMHNWWYYQEVSAYFTANIAIHNINFLDSQHVYKYGIPLRTEFAECNLESKEQLREKLQLSVKEKIYLLLGGGEGILPMQEIICAIKRYEPMSSIVTITGHNKKLYKQLKKLNIEGVSVFGFVNNICDFIVSADCVVSKAGGVSSAEILSQSAKYIVYKPLMGQELNNALFIANNFQVQIATSVKELIAALAFLNSKTVILTPVVSQNSTERIVKEIFNLTKKHNCEYNV